MLPLYGVRSGSTRLISATQNLLENRMVNILSTAKAARCWLPVYKAHNIMSVMTDVSHEGESTPPRRED